MKRLCARFSAASLCAAVAVSSVQADPLFQNGNSRKLFAAKTRFLDQRAATQYRDSERLRPERHLPDTAPRYAGSYKGQYLDLARQAARRYGIPEDLFLRLIQQESNWNPRAKSHKGALGLAQLMPQTAKSLGVNPHVPTENLSGGAKYLAQQYRTFGSWRLALAAYNAGPQAVRKYGGVPPYKETRNYVRKILGS